MGIANLNLKTCYALLDVDPAASQQEIKTAYRQLVYQYHPDLNPDRGNAEIRLKEINAAYARICERLAQKTPPGVPSRPDQRQQQDEAPDNGMYDSFVYAITGRFELL
ncbi:hypothetical protein BST81_19580 [Leptolyngbya sp. 'hensonii']|uniref:DnaJ domain-containing protein n=1 Tax=Leptolyngbya sp. 'hensonii' TaxID=1922337 RepID=UPI00094F8C5E|nr:DnaJ domain-containing protein [Leptolyngbya sp. 'hensonii']OLP16641.1 hypothetical protein BST81_19580 [Leptolyngbya sp. 'hensonii']